MFSRFNTLLIPVESQVREFDGKLLLACVAAEKNYKVIIGSRAHIHFYASRVKDAIYIAKSMRRFSNRMFTIMHELGHKIVAWDEEALVRLPDEEYYLHRLSSETFRYIDLLFAWGESNAATFMQYPGYRNQPIHVFGNPRVDILRPELRNYFLPEVNDIQDRHGNYILINTNFGQVNHFIQAQGLKEAARDKKHDSVANNSYMQNRFSHKQKLFTYFQSMILELCNTFKDVNFVLRPHPSENVEFWNSHLKSVKNAQVSNVGNVVPWILGSKALISNGCTTSIEATILGIPTLGYYPISNLEVDDVLPKALCDVSLSTKQLTEKIDNILSGIYKTNRKSEIILGQHIANLEGELASDRIVKQIYSYYINDTTASSNLFYHTKGAAHNEVRTLVKKFNSSRKSHRNSAQYHKHRFPKIEKEYLTNRINRFNELTGRFNQLSVSNVSDYLFCISS